MKYNKLKKITITFLLLICSTFILNIINFTWCNIETNIIEHLCINGIISFPSIFNDNRLNSTLEEENITPTEFQKILNSLYKSNYVLVKFSDCYGVSNNTPYTKKLPLPKGKKPIIISTKDVAYGKSGKVNKLIIDDDNNIASYTSKRSINERIHYDKEFVTILESFVKKHPDFSYNNAKGLIIVEGKDGIFGYKTQKTNANSKFQTKKCIEVINILKKNGWEFCAQNYNGSNFSSPNIEFASGLNTWNNNVRALVGNTNVYYVNDNLENVTNNEYKFELLSNNGFNILLNNSFKPTFNGTNINNTLIINTKKINGDALRNHRNEFLNMFDSEIIYDRLHRKIPF